MRNIHALCLWFFAAMLLLASCKKDDDNGNNPGQTGCKVVKAYVYDISTGTISDSVFYTHSGNNVSKLQYADGYITLDYNSSNQITRRNYFTGTATTPDEYMQITYNTDGTISKVERFENVGTSYSSYSRNDVTYTSGKINKVLVYDVSNGVSTLVDEYTFTYTGNNITGVSDKYSSGGQNYTDNYTYTYDTNNNYLQKQYSQFIFVDPAFGEFEPIFLPVVLSANNLTQMSLGSQSAPFAITTDSRQNVSAVNFGGRPLITYTYQCQ